LESCKLGEESTKRKRIDDEEENEDKNEEENDEDQNLNT
jgi:hypothetical protein